jgi:MFS family permease
MALAQASCFALITTAFSFSIRAGILPQLGLELSLTNEQLGHINQMWFLGFPISMILGGIFYTSVGPKLIMQIALVAHAAGILLTIYAVDYNTLLISTLLIGLGNGCTEAACNPMIADAYTGNEMSSKLNRFHMWFPGGIVIGGLVSFFFLDQFHIPWRFLMATLIIPNLIYGFLAFNSAFPVSERVSSGTSSSEMYKSLLNPLFIVMVACMMLTAATELGTNQWITALLANVGVPSILLLVFINGIMALGRGFAGELAHKLAPTGILLFSAIFSTLGLVLLSYSHGYLAFFSAAVFAVGVCYFCPTMLGFVSEYLPKTGPMGLSIMGGAGMLSVSFILPMMGKRFDNNLTGLIPENYILETLKNAVKNTKEATLWTQINLEAGSQTLLSVAVLPLFLVFVFACIFIFMRNKTTTNDN